MIEGSVLVGPAFDALKWLIARLADADDPEKLGENAGKIVGGMAMSLLGDAASARWSDAKTDHALRSADEPLNHYIEQAYRLAELGALAAFLRRLQRSGRLASDPHGGPDAERSIRSLSTLRSAVLARREAASIRGVELHHLAATLSSLTGQDWDQADAHAQRLRREVEDRALHELEISSNVPPSPAFVQAFREGLGDGLPPWFGLLSHHFVHVLLTKDRKEAQESLMLRMLARVATRVEPAADTTALERLLRHELQALQAHGDALSTRVEALLSALGDQLGSRLDSVESELTELSQRFAEFERAWQDERHAMQAHRRDLLAQLDRNGATLDRIEDMVERLVADRDAAPAEPGDWAAAALPPLPPPDCLPRGRDTELAAVRAFAADPAPVLLRVSGRGGSGKTTLVASALAGLGARPRIYLKATGPAEPLSAPLWAAFDRLLQAVGDTPLASDTRFPGLAEKTVRLFERLSAHALRPLVVLDSLEQALGPDGRLADADLERLLLLALPAQRVLQVVICAQRMPQVEHDGRLRPLLAVSLERQREVALGVGLAHVADAVAVLRELVAGARPELAKGEAAPLWALAEAAACSPIALKHVAIGLAEDPLLSPQALLAALQSPVAGDEAALAVQQELIGYSFARLSAPARRLLQALAVLGGSADLSALQSTAGSPGGGAKALLEMHLLRQGPDGRLAMHDTERAWCLAHADATLLGELRLRGADHFAAGARPLSQWTGFADAEPTLHEATLRAAAGQVHAAAILRLGAARRLHEIGRSLAALGVLDAADHTSHVQGDVTAHSALRAECLWKTGAYEAASRVCEAALAVAPPGHTGVQSLRQTHATCRLELGDALQAVADGQRLIVELDRDGADPAVRTRAQVDLAFALSVAGRQDEALAVAEGALARAAVVPGPQRDALAVLGRAYLGLVHSYRGDFGAARRHYNEGLRLALRQPGLYERAIALGHFAELELIEGNFDIAVDLASRSLQAEAETDAMNGSWCNWLIGMALALDPARIAGAEARARDACRFTRLLNDPNPRTLLGLLLLRRGERVAGIGELEHALATTDTLIGACSTNWEAWAARGLARALLATAGRADIQEALDAYQAAHSASPHVGHFARIALQLQIAAPVLEPAGLELLPALRTLYMAHVAGPP